jgi:hypothetical protein
MVAAVVVGFGPLAQASGRSVVHPLATSSHSGLPDLLTPTVLHEPDIYQFRGVSCTSATHCVAVGYAQGPSITGGVAVPITNGHLGTPIISADTNSIYAAVSCVSATTCLVVGWTAPSPITKTAAVWVLRGRTMTEIPEPATPVNLDSQFLGVDCATATRCEVAGDATVTASQAIAEFATVSLAGSGSMSAVDNNALAYVGGVSCPATSTCLVGGSSAGETGEVAKIVGGHISGVSQPSISGVEGIACESVGSCEGAEVQDLSTPGQFQGWLEHLNSSLKGTPHRETGTQQMYSVATINSSYYLAVGYGGAAGWTTALVSASGTAQPAHSLSYGGYLQSVSCPVPTECVAVGFSTDSDATQPGGFEGVDGGVALIHLRTAPAAPRIKVVSTHSTSIRLKLIAPADTGGASITGYRLMVDRCAKHGSACHPHRVKTMALSRHEGAVTVRGLRPKTRYEFAASATNTVGTGPWSADVFGRTH